MWELIAGGAAILIGGAYFVCKELETDNEQKAAKLSSQTIEYTRELNAQRAEFERINSMNDKAAQLEKKQQLFIAFKQKSDEAHQVYLAGHEQIKTLNKQLKATFEAKERAKKELENIKVEKFADKIKGLWGKKVNKQDSPEFQKKLQEIRDYGAFCQNLIKMRNEQEELLKVFHARLQELNCQTHQLNLDRKQLKNESSTSLVCNNCGKTFLLTAGELLFYKQKSLNFPKKCPECRAAKRLNQ